jgi:hypothetical protein
LRRSKQTKALPYPLSAAINHGGDTRAQRKSPAFRRGFAISTSQQLALLLIALLAALTGLRLLLLLLPALLATTLLLATLLLATLLLLLLVLVLILAHGRPLSRDVRMDAYEKEREAIALRSRRNFAYGGGV